MREQGIITKVLHGNIVEVAFKRSAACEKCRLCHAVDEGLVAIEAKDDIGAKVGDMVEIEISSQEIVKGSLMLFIFPILFLAAGYLLFYKLTNSETLSIVAGIISLALSFVFVRWYNVNIEQKELLRAKVVKKC